MLAVAILAAGVAGLYLKREAVYRQILLAQVADLATDAEDPEQQALDVLDHIRQMAPLRPSEVIDDDPAATLVRGWGYCDSLAMSYVQVLERIGLRGRLLFLWDEQGTSPHTVAAVWLDSEWRIIDAQTGVVPRTESAEIASAADIAAGSASVTGGWVEPGDYGRATVVYETPGEHGLARRAARAGAEAVAAVASTLAQDLYLATSPPTYTSNDGKVWEDWTDPGDKAYWRARHYALFGRDADAADAYRAALSSPSDRSGDAEFFLGHGG